MDYDNLDGGCPVCVQIFCKGSEKQVEIPFWVLAHLRALSVLYADTSDRQEEYMKAYQDGFCGSTVIDWLGKFDFPATGP